MIDPSTQSASSAHVMRARLLLVLDRVRDGVCLVGFELLLYLVLAFCGFAPQSNLSDLGWHLAQGDWMLTHGAFLRQDVFNYPNLHAPLINEYPFYQGVIALAWRFGETGGGALCAAALIGLYAIYFQAGRKLANRLPLTFCASLLVSVLLALPRFNIRPELVTSLGIVFFITFLLRHCRETDWRRFWPLFLVQVLWVNSHSGFILGLAIVWGFALEMVLRAAWTERHMPVKAIRPWSLVCLGVVIACLVNPYGLPRLWLPFYHQGNETIRAYVEEMRPYAFSLQDPFVILMLLQLLLLAWVCWRERGGVSWSLMVLSVLALRMTFVSERHLTLYAMIAPGTVLSVAVFSRRTANVQTASFWKFLAALGLLSGALLLFNAGLNKSSAMSPLARWRDWNNCQTEMPVTPVAWMKAHGITGRLFNRSEYGGWLQYQGYNTGQVYADTGFGKFSESFIREIGLSCEEPASLPVLLRRYQPDAALVSNMGYGWPVYLKQEGWRCVYYALDGSVWLPPGVRPDLPTISSESIREVYRTSRERLGYPARVPLVYRQLLALYSMGEGDFVVDQLLTLPSGWSKIGLFWIAAQKMIVAPPGLSTAALQRLENLAQQPDHQTVSAIFRLTRQAQQGDWRGVIETLERKASKELNDTEATLLADAYLHQKQYQKAALLLRQDTLFELANAHRYEMLAQVEDYLGRSVEATRAREQALRFGPLKE